MISRRKFLGTAAAAAAAGASIRVEAVASAQTPRTPRTIDASGRTLQDQTLVLTNGRIHTMDARNTVATPVSINNGRFVAVGGTAPAAGRGVTVLDLKGRTVVPGLLE